MMFSIVMSSYFMPRRASTILKYSSEVCALARPTRLPLRSSTLCTPEPWRATMASGSSALSRVASFMMMPITRNGSPPWRAFRKVVTLMSPICTSRFCIEVTMSVPVLTTLRRTSTPCRLNKPLSTPTTIGRWPKLVPITASTTGTSCALPGAAIASKAAATAATRMMSLPKLIMVAPMGRWSGAGCAARSPDPMLYDQPQFVIAAMPAAWATTAQDISALVAGRLSGRRRGSTSRFRLSDPDGEDPGKPQEEEIETEEDRQARGRPNAFDHGADQIIGDIADDHEHEIDDDQ